MHYAGVELEVLEADALGYPSDLLVLKYAQASYGVDGKAVRVAGIDSSELPAAGDSLLLPDPPHLSARNLLFLGVEPIYAFDYRSIRRFARRAVFMAAEISPPVHDISMTMHGVGFGLDEAEAFASQIAGIVEALDSDHRPGSLRAIRIVELNRGRVNRMRRVLFSILDPGGVENRTADPQPAGEARRSYRIGSASYDPAARPHAFVAMPFADSYEDIFYYGISPSVRAAGLLCERIDQFTFTGDIVERMRNRIASSTVVVADLSEANPNVYLEVGYAWGVNVPCVLICNKRTELKFDLRGQRCLFYGSIMELEKNLSAELTALSRQMTPRRSASRG
jgi:hypothetical protein